MAKKEIAIKVENLTKTFKIPLEAHSGLKQKLINTIKGRKGYREFTPLKDISFEIEKGDFFGIVGRNGSGKSTLLKSLAGIYTPNKGAVHVNGTLVPFIELGVGFNPELTGRENVFLNGALLGFSHKQMEEMYDGIVDFAELHDFMEERLKNYSSGMQVRLAFSIAIRAEGDILLLDEVLAVGDQAFQQKCYEYFASLKEKKKTVILVSHSMAAIERFCTKALLIENGSIVKCGTSNEIATLYEKMFINDDNKKADKKTKRNKTLKVDDFSVNADIIQDEKKVSSIESSRPFTVSLQIDAKKSVQRLNIGLNIRNTEGVIVFSQDIRNLYDELELERNKSITVKFIIENFYTNGTYNLDIIMVDEGKSGATNKLLYVENNLKKFNVSGIRDHVHSLFHPPVRIEVSQQKKDS